MSSRIAILEAGAAVVFWGASFIATKVALRDASPVTVVWLRFGLGILVLGAAVLARKEFERFSARELAYFALLGFLGITFHQWLQSNALVTSQATTSAWIVSTTPVFIAILALVWLREAITRLRIAGIALAAFGVALVVSKGDFNALSLGRFGRPGDSLILLSAINWAVFTIFSRSGLRRHPATLMMFIVMLIGWLFVSLLFVSGRGWMDFARLSPEGWLGIGFLGIFCSGLAYIFWYDALKQLPASQVGVFLYLEPLVTVVVAALVLQESLGFATAVGGAVILLGVWLVNRPVEDVRVGLQE